MDGEMLERPRVYTAPERPALASRTRNSKLDDKKRRPLVGGRLILLGLCCGLERLYVLSLQALGSLFHFELYRLAFLQAAETVRLDGRKMHENIFAALARDESETLGIVKPLHCSLFHDESNSFNA